MSDEPWAWATYHYGRWDFTDQYGWYWVPQTQWAPAWVSWHEGGGYVGWAPLQPSGVRVILPRAYVIVEERHFMEPVSRSTVVANSTTIINKTVINKGPATTVIEKASGRKVQAVPVQELRQKTEAAVVAKQKTPTATSEKTIQPPVRNEAQPAEKKAVAVPESPQVEKPAGQNANKQPVKQEMSAQPSDKKEQQPAKEKPAASEKNEPNTADKDHENNVKE